MGKADPENCPHPLKRHRTAPHFGATQCGRCDADLTPENRSFVVQHSERVTLRTGDLVRVSGGHSGGSGVAFTGQFQYAEDGPSGRAYMVGEIQKYQVDKTWHRGIAAWRTVRPEHVRQAPGVRDRKAREEAA